jgi:hypothetical protein
MAAPDLQSWHAAIKCCLFCPCDKTAGDSGSTIAQPAITMKKVFSLATLLLLSSAAQAQAHSDSGSAKPKNPHEMQYNERQLQEAEQAKKRRVLVRCRDGSKHIARVCRRHGGIA